MEMVYIVDNPNKNELNNIRSMLGQGKLVVYPTDTIYGIGVDINNIHAVKKVYMTKKRSYDKPISICLHDITQVKEVAIVTDEIEHIINELLPGPYTLLLRKKSNIPDILTANTNIIGIRIPDNKITHSLTKDFPITSTSANLSNIQTPDNITDIKKQLGDNIDIYIDCGKKIKNQPSTIIDLTQQNPKIIRQHKNNELINKILKIDLY